MAAVVTVVKQESAVVVVAETDAVAKKKTVAHKDSPVFNHYLEKKFLCISSLRFLLISHPPLLFLRKTE